MGRPSLPPEKIRENRISIIRGAMEMIRESGITSVSARALGSRIGMNSAMIYRFFRDIDEVVLYACVHDLQDYSAEMDAAFRDLDRSDGEVTDSDLYIISWQLFCRHAFSSPDEYTRLFFSRHSTDLSDIIKEYYDLFPPEAGDLDDDYILRAMYMTSDLRKRNLLLLIPVLESRKTEQEIIMINDMTISYFYSLLLQLSEAEAGHGITPEIQTERMLMACRYTTDQ